MADVAPPLINPGALPVYTTTKATGTAEEIRKYIVEELQPKFVAKKAEKETDPKINLKDYCNADLFEEVNNKFNIEQLYAVGSFKKTLYSMLNSKANYKKSKTRQDPAAPPQTANPAPSTSRFRSKTGLDMYRADEKQKQLITDEATIRLKQTGETKGKGKAMNMSNKVATEWWDAMEEEEKAGWTAKADVYNAAAKEKKSSAEEIERQVFENQANYSSIIVNALQPVLGDGPGQIGRGIFWVFGAFRDSTGKLRRQSGVVANPQGDPHLPLPKLNDISRLEDWARDSLMHRLVKDATGNLRLPILDTSRLWRREMRNLLYEYFAPAGNETIMLPLPSAGGVAVDIDYAKHDQLAEYYQYVLQCQEENTNPEKYFVTCAESDGNRTGGEDGDDGKSAGGSEVSGKKEEGAGGDGKDAGGGAEGKKRTGGDAGDDEKSAGGSGGSGNKEEGAGGDGKDAGGGAEGKKRTGGDDNDDGKSAGGSGGSGNKEEGAGGDGKDAGGGVEGKKGTTDGAPRPPLDFSPPWVPVIPRPDGPPPKSPPKSDEGSKPSARAKATRGSGRGKRGGRGRGGGPISRPSPPVDEPTPDDAIVEPPVPPRSPPRSLSPLSPPPSTPPPPKPATDGSIAPPPVPPRSPSLSPAPPTPPKLKASTRGRKRKAPDTGNDNADTSAPKRSRARRQQPDSPPEMELTYYHQNWRYARSGLPPPGMTWEEIPQSDLVMTEVPKKALFD
ncbi:hypothetical protein R3P38DRAFT_3238646 [Favolaschia claudopus]|uniref:Uncharacterized protein n=1 Tax=Favolaschia claudopus TaxID=2862362 RepID=A0AAV9Z9Z1_9AGAR